MMMKIEECKEEQVVIRLEGNITSNDMASIQNELFQLVENGYLYFTFKIDSATKLNRSFVGLLVAIQQQVAEKGGSVTMCFSNGNRSVH